MAVMYSLGKFLFSSKTIVPTGVVHGMSYNWQSVDRNGRRPARQPVGVGLETVSLQGVTYPCELPIAWTFDELRVQANEMRPLTLISFGSREAGNWATVLGLWTMDDLNEDRQALWPNSDPRKIQFSLKLSFYGLDGQDGAWSWRR
jgi:phage protein U